MIPLLISRRAIDWILTFSISFFYSHLTITRRVKRKCNIKQKNKKKTYTIICLIFPHVTISGTCFLINSKKTKTKNKNIQKNEMRKLNGINTNVKTLSYESLSVSRNRHESKTIFECAFSWWRLVSVARWSQLPVIINLTSFNIKHEKNNTSSKESNIENV